MSKLLYDNPPTTDIRDKNLILSQEGGKDYVGSWTTLLDNLKTDLLRPILKAQIGQIMFNLDPKYKNISMWNNGVFEYCICDGRGINAVGYPELAAVYGSNLPNFQNATIRNLPAGDSRALGSYQADALQNLTGSAFNGGGSALLGDGNSGIENVGTGVFKTSIDTRPNLAGGSKDMAWRTFAFDASFVARTADETRMQNIGVQFYVIARVII